MPARKRTALTAASPAAPRTPRPSRGRAAASPDACAAAVLDVVPAVMDAMRAAMRRHVGPQMSVPQFRCLAFIAHEPGGSIGDVAAFLGVSMPTASAMVDRLVRAGGVAPQEDPQDRRRVQLRITAAGRAQMEQIRDGARRDLSQALAQRGASELQTLQDGLDELRRSFTPLSPRARARTAAGTPHAQPFDHPAPRRP